MKRKNIQIHHHLRLEDCFTPVLLYYKVRDWAPDPIMLESLEHHNAQNSRSFIAVEPIAEIKVRQNGVHTRYKNVFEEKQFTDASGMTAYCDEWMNAFEFESEQISLLDFTGFFGYCAYAGAQLDGFPARASDSETLLLHYRLYRFVIVFDHFHHRLTILENKPEGEDARLPDFLKQVERGEAGFFPMQIEEERQSGTSDGEFLDMVKAGKAHCQRGDVFQVVLSRKFTRGYTGDPFQLYRALRSVNPSPYMFYFDCGNYKLLGASPEAQLTIQSGSASIYPIAGTYRRSGDSEEDQRLAEKLQEDPKEQSEHVMLVDLARNDLNRIADGVEVDFFQVPQFFSHVIHLTSKVTGEVKSPDQPLRNLLASFPAGTLSGAPKHRAMEIIAEQEREPRDFYAGTVGLITPRGGLTHAIFIRSVCCRDGRLTYQAGAGIVIDSVPEKELQEVENKLGAIEKAIQQIQNQQLS